MVIRPEMLAAHRIDWNDKARNVEEIAAELGVALESVVFIEQSPVDRARVRETLRGVYVPEWPSDPACFGRALESLRCFDSARTSHDARASRARSVERADLLGATSSLDEWLDTLGLRVRFERLLATNLEAAAELVQKSSQMNLRTRRMAGRELLEWSLEDPNEVWVAYVADRFGDAGLSGLFALTCVGERASLEDYVVSGRVIGRRVEETMLWAATRRAAARGARELVIAPLPTSKNRPCLDFFDAAGLKKRGEAWVVAVTDGVQAPRVAVEGM